MCLNKPSTFTLIAISLVCSVCLKYALSRSGDNSFVVANLHEQSIKQSARSSQKIGAAHGHQSSTRQRVGCFIFIMGMGYLDDLLADYSPRTIEAGSRGIVASEGIASEVTG